MKDIMEHRFDLLMNPPKVLKCRMIVMALQNTTIDNIPESHGQVRQYMRLTLKHIDPLYDMALAALNSRS